MAGGSPGGGRGALSEINVTPLVDVMLVLLVVFMVTVPVIVDQNMPRKVEVDLPRTASNVPLNPDDVRRMVLNLDMGFKISIAGEEGEAPLELIDCSAAKQSGDFMECLAPLEAKLKANVKVQEEKRVFLQADRRLPYGFVVDVMSRIRNAGIPHLGMVTNPPDTGGAP